MGLFGSKKKTYVSSSVWNMAGDIKDRTNYLKSTVAGSVLLGSGSLGEDIPRTYLNGPGMGLKKYARWAKGPSGYDDQVGFVGGGLSFGDSIDPAILEGFLPKLPTEFLILNEYDLGFADSDWWAEEYMVNNHQSLLFTDWFSELDTTTGAITITFADTTTAQFTPTGFDSKSKYLYALYQVVSGGVTGSTVLGPITTLPSDNFPSPPAGYTLHGSVDEVSSVNFDVLTVVDVTYSDARPPEHTETISTIPGSLTNNITTYHKYTLVNRTASIRDLYVQERKDRIKSGTPVVTTIIEDIGGGVIKTTTTSVTTQTTEKEYLYHYDTQTVINDSISRYGYYRYKYGTGIPDLDAMFKTPETAGQYLPYIPIRINNQFLRDTDPVIYKKTKRACFKAMAGGSLDKVVKKIEDNEQLGDLDFVYIVYGTSLNSPEVTAREYMYRFFDNMASTSSDSYVRFQEWEAKWAEAIASMELYDQWAQSYHPGSNTPPPVVIPYPELPVISLDTKSTTNWMNFHMAVQLNGINKITGTGLLGSHKIDDYWIEQKPTKVFKKSYVNLNTSSGPTSGSGYNGRFDYDIEVEHMTIYHQVSATHWEAIELYGLVHKNYVYDGKWVVIKGSEAMNDPEESGFIIPLHEDTFRSMSLISSTQLATASCYLVFNCYKVVKQKWYQSGWFKIVLVVAVIVVSIIFPPAGAGSAGVLGTSAAVGTAIGFTGTAAIVAGTIANALAAMLIAKALTSVVGDRLGPILSAAVVIGLTVYGGVNGNGNFDFSTALSELGKTDNLIALTDGLVKSVSAFMNEKTMKIMEETRRMMEHHKQDMLEIAKRYEEMFGTGTQGVIDPLAYMNAGYTGDGESRGAYIERTLMCGGDIAQLSQDLINNFTKVALSLELPS